MNVKRFTARTSRDALTLVRQAFGEDAVVHIVKHCNGAETGVYKFIPGATAATRTVLRSSTELMLDAFRELDENEQDSAQGGPQ